MKLSLQYPVTNVTINQRFGENATPIYKQLGMSGHNGIDFYALDGTPVFASHNGTIVFAGLDGSNGNLVVIKTDTQFDYLDGQAYYKTLYGHLKTGTICVHAGQQVKVGDKIAEADNTGASQGSHLHFGIKPVQQGEADWQWFNLEQDKGYNGAIDPMSFLPGLVEYHIPLKKGDTGFEVEKLQAYLLRKGYMSPVDKLGFYGDVTCAAVLKFQLDKCVLSWYERYILKGSVVGQKTLTALNLNNK